MNEKEREFLEKMEKIPFPEHLFKKRSQSEKEFFRANWNGNPEKFIENCERSMGIKTEVVTDENGEVSVLVKKIRPPSDTETPQP